MRRGIFYFKLSYNDHLDESNNGDWKKVYYCVDDGG